MRRQGMTVRAIRGVRGLRFAGISAMEGVRTLVVTAGGVPRRVDLRERRTT